MKTEEFNPIKDQFLKLAPEDVWLRETAFMVQIVNSEYKLQQTTVNSRLKALYNVAVTGLTLNPIHKHCYLLTRGKKQRDNSYVQEAYLEPSYRGMVHLAVQGGVGQVYAYPVYVGDEFDISLGSSMDVVHKPKFQSKEILQSYAIAKWADKQQIEVLTVDDINAIMARSEGVKAAQKDKSKEKYSVWMGDWKPEMVRKAAIKRLCKYLPQVNDNLNKAIDLDNENYSLEASPQQVVFIEQLLSTSVTADEDRFELEAQLEGGITQDQGNKIIENLMSNQQIPGHHRTPGSMKEVNQAVQNKLDDPRS